MTGPAMAQPDPIRDAEFYEGVPLRRAVAFVLDAILITLLGLVTWLVVTLITFGIGFFLFPVIAFAVSFAYRWLTIASSSATPGMMFLGVELRNLDGYRLTPVEAALHTGIFLILMLSVIGWIATVVAILATERRQGLPDLVLGTVAINRPHE